MNFKKYFFLFKSFEWPFCRLRPVVCWEKEREEGGEGEKERRLDFFVFASYHGVNAPIVSNFKLPRFNKQLANFWISNNWLLWACTRTPLLVTKRALANLLSHEAIEMREVVTRALVWPASALLHPRKSSCLHRYSLRGREKSSMTPTSRLSIWGIKTSVIASFCHCVSQSRACGYFLV